MDGSSSWATSLQREGRQHSSQDGGSPSKLLPPKTPAPVHPDASMALPGSPSPPVLTQALQRGAVALADSAAARSSQAGTSQALPPSGAGNNSDGSDDSLLLHDDVLLFTDPAVSPSALDPQLLVHSPGSSLGGGEGSLLTRAAPTNTDLEPSHQRQRSMRLPDAAAEAGAEEADGERTPRHSSGARVGAALDLLSPSVDPSFSLADMLQDPAELARSPGSRHAFLPGPPQLEGVLGLSPRRSLPTLSPLVLTGLRDPPNLLGLPPPPPLGPHPPALLPPTLPAVNLPPLLRAPASASSAPPLRQQPGAAPSNPHALRRPLLQPIGRGLPLGGPLPSSAGPLKQQPLLRPSGPPAAMLPRPHGPPGVPPGMRAMPVGGGMARPAGQQLLVPTSGERQGGGCSPDNDEVLTAEGLRLVARASAEPLKQQQQQQQLVPAAATQEQLAGGKPLLAGPQAASGTAVPIQAVDAIRAPGASAAFAAMKAEATAAASWAGGMHAPASATRSSLRGAAAATPGPQQPGGHAMQIGRPLRAPGGDPLQSPAFRTFLAMLRANSTVFEAQGRVLRLRQFLKAGVRPEVLNAVLDALEANTRVEALYIQNFEQGLLDEQLERLVRVLRHKRIWALNVGENFGTSREAWRRFAYALPDTAVAYLFVSEQHLAGTDFKERMQDAIRANRRAAPLRDPEVIVHVGNMWWNPKLPSSSTCSPRTAAAMATVAQDAALEVAVPLPAGTSRPSLSGGGSGSGASAASRASSGAANAGSAAVSAAASASAAATTAATDSDGLLPAVASVHAAAGSGSAATTAVASQQQGHAVLAARKRRQGSDDYDCSPSSPPAKRNLATSAPVSEAVTQHASKAMAAEAAALQRVGPAADPAAAAGRIGSGRRVSRPSAALLLQQQSAVLSDSEDDGMDRAYVDEEDGDDAAYLPFKSGVLVAGDLHAGPTRASRRLQRRSPQAYQGRLPMDEEFVTYDAGEEPPSPARAIARRRPQQATPGSAVQQRGLARDSAATSQHLPVHSSSRASVMPVSGAGASRHGGAPRAAAAAAKRSVQSAAQRIRSSSRQSAGELKGRPSFAELVEAGFMQPGSYRFTVGMQDIYAALEPDGTILYAGTRYRAISKFALVVLRERNPLRQSCDGWKEVAWNGEKLDVLRARFQSHQRKAAARKAAAPTAS